VIIPKADQSKNSVNHRIFQDNIVQKTGRLKRHQIRTGLVPVIILIKSKNCAQSAPKQKPISEPFGIAPLFTHLFALIHAYKMEINQHTTRKKNTRPKKYDYEILIINSLSLKTKSCI